MSNRRRIRPLPIEYRHLHLVHVSQSPDWPPEGPARVAAASGLLQLVKSSPDKRETPEVGAPEVSTDRKSCLGDPGGCSQDSA